MRFFTRLFSHTVIAFADGRCVEVRGKVGTRILQDLAECLLEAGARTAEIRIGGDGRARFSEEIPPDHHQRLRNILAQV